MQEREADEDGQRMDRDTKTTRREGSIDEVLAAWFYHREKTWGDRAGGRQDRPQIDDGGRSGGATRESETSRHEALETDRGSCGPGKPSVPTI